MPGDGIGPEVTREAVALLREAAQLVGIELAIEEHLVGGAAVDATGDPLPAETAAACLEADAVLFGAIGGPRWDREPRERRPEAGLLRLRKHLGVFANLRPLRIPPGAARRTPLREDVVATGVDVLIVRELTGGLYFGERGRQVTSEGRRAFDTMVYSEAEIERLLRLAFELARQRRRCVTSVDKENVLETSRLWREVAEQVAADYPDVELEHMYVDNCAMQLVRAPGRFDVLVTENMFGDILSDLGGALVGSLGVLPSASLGEPGRPGLYEPIHGSAPDIAGRGISNPLGAIGSVAMLFRYSLALPQVAAAIEGAVDEVLREGPWTPDLAAPGARAATTAEVGAEVRRRVIARLQAGEPAGS